MSVPSLLLLKPDAGTGTQQEEEEGKRDRKPPASVHDLWIASCGARRPAFRRWSKLDGKAKERLLHAVAVKANDDAVLGTDSYYRTPYDEMRIRDVVTRRVWSVEHVLPRSYVNGKNPGKAENDPNGWVVATRSANSRRSNHPLMLWLDSKDGRIAPPNRVVIFDDGGGGGGGVAHYVPPVDQRARLARKWLFLRATYCCGQGRDSIAPPTAAQQKHRNDIIALAKTYPIQATEILVNEHYRETYGWANPLLEEDAARWYDDPAWRNLVFGTVAREEGEKEEEEEGARG